MYEVHQDVKECVFVKGLFMYPCSVPSNDAPDDVTMNKLLTALMEAPGLGTRCMEGYPFP